MSGANVVFTNITGGRAFVRCIANATMNVAANTTANSDLAPFSNDQITGASITKLMWSTANTIKIARGANTIINLTGSGNWNLKEMGCTLNEFASATIVVTINDAGSTLLMECTKMYPTGSE